MCIVIRGTDRHLSRTGNGLWLPGTASADGPSFAGAEIEFAADTAVVLLVVGAVVTKDSWTVEVASIVQYEHGCLGRSSSDAWYHAQNKQDVRSR